jgi:hypothetical protein
VWDKYVMEGIADADTFRQGLLDAQEATRAECGPKQSELDATLSAIAKTEAGARDLADEIAKVQKGGLMYRTLQARETEIDRQYASLCKHRDKLHKELAGQTISDQAIDHAMSFRERVVSGLQNPTFEMKRAFLDFIRVEVTVKGKKVTVMGNLPVKVRVFDLDIQTDGCIHRRGAAREC